MFRLCRLRVRETRPQHAWAFTKLSVKALMQTSDECQGCIGFFAFGIHEPLGPMAREAERPKVHNHANIWWRRAEQICVRHSLARVCSLRWTRHPTRIRALCCGSFAMGPSDCSSVLIHTHAAIARRCKHPFSLVSEA